jgi:uncharacterized damage-inducible protein DinB
MSSGLRILSRMAINNAWANVRLHRAVATLDEAAYRATNRTSFFPSLHLTLVHILFVDIYYLDALEGGGRGRTVWDDEATFEREQGFAAVRELQRATDKQAIAFVERLDDLARETRIDRVKTGIQIDTAESVLLHMFEHSIHHRGQVHAMLSGTSAAPPQLDEFFLREDFALREAELREAGLPVV